MSATRVLVVDDDVDIRAVLRRILEQAGFEVLEAGDGAMAFERTVVEQPDVVLLDMGLPGMDGLAVLRELRTDARTAHVPVLLVAAAAQPEGVVAGLDAGADDHLTRPFDGDEVVARIRAVVRRATQQSSRNPLTGLPGNERITTELSSRIDRGDPTALLYVDVDDFKPYNDHYGFLRGDHALRELGGLIVEVVKHEAAPGAFVGHVGGDDFVVIVEPHEAERVAEAICERFDAMAPSLYDPGDAAARSIEVPDRRGVPQRYGLLSLSIGVATTDRREVEHREELVTAATEMKRYAKSRSRDRSRYAFDRRVDGDDAVELEVDLP